MSAFNDLPGAVLLSARKAFTLVLAQYKVNVPMSEIIADTITDRDGKHVRVLWRQGLSRRTSAEGRFYPDSTSSGGVIHLDHFQPDTVQIQPEACKYTFSVTEDSCLQLTVAP